MSFDSKETRRSSAEEKCSAKGHTAKGTGGAEYMYARGQEEVAVQSKEHTDASQFRHHSASNLHQPITSPISRLPLLTYRMPNPNAIPACPSSSSPPSSLTSWLCTIGPRKTSSHRSPSLQNRCTGLSAPTELHSANFGRKFHVEIWWTTSSTCGLSTVTRANPNPPKIRSSTISITELDLVFLADMCSMWFI